MHSSLFIICASDFDICKKGFKNSLFLHRCEFGKEKDIFVLEDMSVITKRKHFKSLFGVSYVCLSFFSLFYSMVLCFSDLKFFLTPNSLYRFSKNGVKLGPFLYDAVLRRYNLPGLDRIDSRCFVYLFLSYIFAHTQARYICRKSFKNIYVQDDTYRQGFLLALLKARGFDCDLFTPIGYNKTYVTRMRLKDFYDVPSRFIDPVQFEEIKSKISLDVVESYLDMRFSGNSDERDALAAFSTQISKEHFVRNGAYTVVVAAHIFCDAPNGYPSLFSDYREWLLETLKILIKVPNVRVLVKPHPSSDYYHEQGYLEQLLIDSGFSNLEIIYDNLNAVKDEFDAVVSCGGTIGLEGLIWGKKVVLGSDTAFSKVCDIRIHSDRVDYFNSLLKIGDDNFDDRSLSQINAKYALFLMNSLFNLDFDDDEKFEVLRSNLNNINYRALVSYNVLAQSFV